jgi:hypothetical protein
MRSGRLESIRIDACRRVTRTALQQYVDSLQPDVSA